MARPDAIACVDVCFNHKRCKKSHDYAEGSYPATFIPKTEVKEMEDEVEGRRTSRKKGHDNQQQDGYEGPLQVPTSVLDGCHESFTAADEKRHKASTKFFADTRLMALLCRHDQVLWLVNMTLAGEKQHYVLALLKWLFENLLPAWTVGLLYDIGCQLLQSFVKWDFLPDYSNRVSFAISIFHAYGHQWPCQLVYHPCKCLGFGFSDGEGCEHFWSSIKNLISILCVSGVSVSGGLIALTNTQHSFISSYRFWTLKSNTCAKCP